MKLDKYLQMSDSIASKGRGDVDSLAVDTKYAFPTGKLNYTNFTKNSKPYMAVVSLSGEKGTFKDIQLAINYASQQGGGVVFIRNGTYVISQDLQMFDGVSLVGETAGGTIIDFDNGAYQIKTLGTLLNSTGTFSVNNNSVNVTGVGTNWTADYNGQYLLVKGVFLYIDVVTSATSLVLGSAYSGDNQTGLATLIATPTGNVSIDNLTVQNSTDALGAVYFQYVLGATMDSVLIYTSTIGLQIKDSDVFALTNWTIDHCGDGLVINNNADTSINTAVVSNCTTGDGISLTNVNTYSQFNFGIFGSAGRGQVMTSCYNFGILNFTVISCTGIGFELLSCNDGNIGAGDFLNNTTDAIKLTSSNLRNSFTNLIFRANGGWGINIAAASDVDNLVLGCILRTNTSGSVTDSGTTTLIRSNVGATDAP